MARLLLAWERGGGSGHAVMLAQLAQRLLARGHEVHLAWRDLEPCARLLGATFGSERLHLWQAPFAHPHAGDAPHPASYPELLLRAGFRDADGLLARVRAWRGMLDSVQPALLLTDYAPTALLAARDGAIALAQIGSSFLVPPTARQPFPAFNDWQPAEPERLDAAERLALDQANRVLVATGRAPLASLRQLLQVDMNVRLGFPELDPYAAHRDPSDPPACGWPEAPDHGGEPEWPKVDGPRVFGYLPREHPALPQVVAQLSAAPVAALLHVPGSNDDEARAASTASLRLSARPLRMNAVLDRASLILCHAPAGSTHLALQAGRPVLLLPMHAEQLLLARQVAAAGAGIFMWPHEVEESFQPALRALLESRGFAAAAQRIAERNRRAPGSSLLTQVAERCEALAGGSP